MPKKLKIKGAIIANEWKWIYDWCEYDATCPKDVETFLADNVDADIELDINSGGGDVYAGSEIYTQLKAHKGQVVGNVVGIAASAASVIAMACNTLNMSPTAQIMIHNAASRSSGDYRNMQHSADVLENWNKSIANAYQLKTGMAQSELLDLMNKETWLNAKQAVDMKFADTIMFDQYNQLVASLPTASKEEMIPVKILEKLRNSGLLQNHKNNSQNPEKGDDSMSLNSIVQKLSVEDQATVLAAIKGDVLEKEVAMQNENTTLLAEVTSLKETVLDLQNKLSTSKPVTTPTDEELLASLDPKVKAMIEDARSKEGAAQAELQRIRDEKESLEFTNLANSFDKLPINASEYGPVFRNMAKADKEGFEMVKALLTAVNNMSATGEVFGSAGTNQGTTGNAWDQIQSKVQQYMNENPKVTKAQATLVVMRAEPALYDQYKDELLDEPVTE